MSYSMLSDAKDLYRRRWYAGPTTFVNSAMDEQPVARTDEGYEIQQPINSSALRESICDSMATIQMNLPLAIFSPGATAVLSSNSEILPNPIV